jgi:hypothetical protein
MTLERQARRREHRLALPTVTVGRLDVTLEAA